MSLFKFDEGGAWAAPLEVNRQTRCLAWSSAPTASSSTSACATNRAQHPLCQQVRWPRFEQRRHGSVRNLRRELAARQLQRLVDDDDLLQNNSPAGPFSICARTSRISALPAS